MSELCARFCPAYQKCQGIDASVVAAGKSLAIEQKYHERAIKSANQAEVYGAFSILSGEFTTKEYEELQAALREGRVERPNFEAATAELRELQARQEAAASVVTANTEILADEVSACDGPRLNWLGKPGLLKMTWSARRLERLSRAPADEVAQRRGLHREVQLGRHAACTTPRVRRAAKKLSMLVPTLL